MLESGNHHKKITLVQAKQHFLLNENISSSNSVTEDTVISGTSFSLSRCMDKY